MLSARTGKVMNKRRNVIVFVCVGLWAALIGRLFYLQIIKHDEYKAAVAENIERETTISASRGTIYDRNMVAACLQYYNLSRVYRTRLH